MKSAGFLLVVFSSLMSFAATLRVPQDFPTVQAAVGASVAGDTIVVSPGSYLIPASPCTLANGSQQSCGLVLHDGTVLVGSGPAQTVLDFSGAPIGILLQNGTATVKLFHLRNTTNHIFAYVGSNITVENVLLADPVGSSVGIELDQGNSYTIHNTTMDNQHKPGTFGIDVPFFGVADIQNNLVTSGDRAFTASSFFSGTYTYNDAFGSALADWSTCTSAGCTSTSAPANNISADPLYCPDFTLQPGSPARNAGNPAILNPDGTRSDMGAYGGPEAILPPLTAAPCVVDFGDVTVGTTSIPATTQVRSTGGVNQTITGISSNNSAFAITGIRALPMVIGPRGNALFSVTFSPQQSGNFSGEIQIVTPNPFPTKVAVKGRGVSQPIVIRTAPYDFFAICNDSSQIEGPGGQASATVVSNPFDGSIDLNVQAAGITASAFGKAGVGINYSPTFTGMVRVQAIVSVGPGFDLVLATGIPKLGKAGIASVSSDVFVSAIPPVDNIATNRFRAAIVTPIGGSTSDLQTYNPPQLFSVEELVSATAGQQLRICGGIQSKAVSTAFPGVFAIGKALYSSHVLEIKIIPQ